MRRVLVGLLCVLVSLFMCVNGSSAQSTSSSSSYGSSSPKRVVVDTDMDFDDYLALLYLMQRKDVEVVGIIVTGVGCVHLDWGVQHALDLVATMGLDIPVIGAYNTPMIYSNMMPYDWRTCADNAYGLKLKKSPVSAPNVTLVDWITGILSEGSVEVLLIGGSTTFAHLSQDLPANVFSKITRWVMMGGNILPKYAGDLGAIGNILPGDPLYNNTVAEWNIFVDVLAASVLVNRSDIDLSLLALNAAQYVPLNLTFLNAMKDIPTTAAQLAYDVVQSDCVYANKSSPFTFLRFWDPLAAMVLTSPELVTLQNWTFYVQQTLNEDIDTSGELVVDPVAGTQHLVAMLADPYTVFETYLKAMKN